MTDSTYYDRIFNGTLKFPEGKTEDEWIDFFQNHGIVIHGNFYSGAQTHVMDKFVKSCCSYCGNCGCDGPYNKNNRDNCPYWDNIYFEDWVDEDND